MKLDAKDLQKKIEEWKLSEWHKFFKQNATICNFWPEWKNTASRSPKSFLENIDWFGNENRLLYNEIRTVFYFCCFKFANKKYFIIDLNLTIKKLQQKASELQLNVSKEKEKKYFFVYG